METLISVVFLTIVFAIAHWWDAFHLALGIPIATAMLYLIWRWQKIHATTSIKPKSFADYTPTDQGQTTNPIKIKPDQDRLPRRALFGAGRGLITPLVVWLVFLIVGATPIHGLFYDRGFNKLVSNDIPLLQSAKANDRIIEIGQQKLEQSLSSKKQKILASIIYQAMISQGETLDDPASKIEAFTQAQEFAQKWNIDFQLAQAKLENTKLQEVIIGPADLPINVGGTITQVDMSSFPPVIIAYVSIEDANGEPIDWLKPKDFLINNNDTPITKFNLAPISSSDQSAIVLAMDVSGSTAGQPLISSKAGAQTFITMLDDNDLIELIKFNQDIDVLVSWQKDKKKLSQEIKKLRAQGNTAIYDALNKGVDDLMRTKQGQKAIVLFTDGSDTDSQCSMKITLDKANMAQIPIYVIGLKSKDLSPVTLNKIASETNGRYLEADNPDELQAMYQKIGNKIKKQYCIVMTVSESNLPIQNSLTISIGRKNGINLAKTYER